MIFQTRATKLSCYYPSKSSFLGKIFYGRWTGTGMDTMDGIDKNGLLNGRWTGTGLDTMDGIDKNGLLNGLLNGRWTGTGLDTYSR